MINRKSAREIKLKHIIQGKLTAYSAKLSSSSFSSRNHSNSKCPKTSRISHNKGKKSSQNPLKNLEKKMLQNLYQYNTSTNSYNIKIVNDIINDERKHIVCLFKNYLLWDEISDFLKRFYFKKESISRLPKITGYYEKYTLFAPVYFQLDCIKLMLKNIKRKKRYLEMIEDNEDKVEQTGQNYKIKEFKNIIKPEDVKTDETKKTLHSYSIGNQWKNNQIDDNDISLTMNLNLKDNINSNENLSQLINNVINNTSISIANNKLDFELDDEIDRSLFNLDQCTSIQKENCLLKGRGPKGIEIKRLNLNKIKAINSEQESDIVSGIPKNKKDHNVAKRLIKIAVNDHSKKVSNNNRENPASQNSHCIEQDIKNQIPSLTATLKGKHKNRIIKDKNDKFTSIDNLFKIIKFPQKQSTDKKKPITSRIVSKSKGYEKDIPISKPMNQDESESTSQKKKKTNLVINHHSIKQSKPGLTLRDNSSRSESKSDSQSKSKSIKKKLVPEFTQKLKNINPLANNTLSNYSKQLLTAKNNDKMMISSIMPQSIYNINLNVNLHSNKPVNISNNQNKTKQTSSVCGEPAIKKKKTDQTQATATANSSKNKEKISYDLNNLHISIHKQTNGSNEPNSNTNNQSVNININCNSVTNNQRDDRKKEVAKITKITRNLDKKISRNDKNIIDKLQSSHTNKIKNMVIPINSSTSKEQKPKIQAKIQPKSLREKKFEKNKNHFNNGHETSMNLVKDKNNQIENQRRYPLTSRNEKESIPVHLLNKIMRKK